MAVPITARAIFQAHVDGMTATGLVDLSIPVSTAWAFEDSAANFDIVDFAAGTTRLQRPPKATMLVIIPPPTNVVVPFLKGHTSDTGIALTPNAASIMSLAPGSQLVSWPAAVAGVRVIWL
jgi:hypothetical protein